MMKNMLTVTVTVGLVALQAATAVQAGASMGGAAKNSYSALMCDQEPSSWFCITNASRENLIKLRRTGCSTFNCDGTDDEPECSDCRGGEWTLKVDAARRTCKSMTAPTMMGDSTCDQTNDLEECCEKRSKCADWKPDGIHRGCPYGYAQKNDAASEYCEGATCSFIDVDTCCKMIKPDCLEVSFRSTPAGDAFGATDKRTCRKPQDRQGEHSGEHATTDSFLGFASSAMECFQMKTAQRSAMETTRIPSMPGPPDSGISYGKPAPRPVARNGDVIDQAARGEEANLCSGFDCEHGGQPNLEADNEWQTYFDISFNFFTQECHSCLPEKTVTKSDGSGTATDPAAFRVSRAGQVNGVKGDLKNKDAYPCKAGKGGVANQVGGYKKDKEGNILEGTGQGKTDAGRDASMKEVGEATHANFLEDADCVNQVLTKDDVRSDRVFDCSCPAGHYILNMRCIKFLSSGEFEDPDTKKVYMKGKACLPSYGTSGNLNKKGQMRKVLSTNKYFPCNAEDSVCADGSCVKIADVKWDCETGFPCPPGSGSDTCKIEDSCGVCGGNGLSCHSEDCEKCYKNFKTGGNCKLADEVDVHIKGALQAAKDAMELGKYQMRSGKTAAIRASAQASIGEGGAKHSALAKEEKEVEALTKKVQDFVEAMGADKCPLKKCWKQVQNNCGRPDICRQEYIELLASGDYSGTSGDSTVQRDMTATAGAAAAYTSDGCALAAESAVTMVAIDAEIATAQAAVDAVKETAKGSASAGVAEEFCGGMCPEAQVRDGVKGSPTEGELLPQTEPNCALCCAEQGGECTDDIAAESNRDGRLAQHETHMEAVRAAERALKTVEDRITGERAAFKYKVQDKIDVKFWGCISQLSAAVCAK